jgi:hypothetical protein
MGAKNQYVTLNAEKKAELVDKNGKIKKVELKNDDWFVIYPRESKFNVAAKITDFELFQSSNGVPGKSLWHWKLDDPITCPDFLLTVAPYVDGSIIVLNSNAGKDLDSLYFKVTVTDNQGNTYTSDPELKIKKISWPQRVLT